MDIQTLSQQLTAFLAPFLPYLLKLGEKAAEEAGKKLGAEAWERARALWGKLRPKVEAKPAAQEAAQEVAAHPADEDAQAALRLQLKKLLAEDEVLAREVQRMLEIPAVRQVIAQGARSVAIGGSVSGSVIVTGDSNSIERKKVRKDDRTESIPDCAAAPGGHPHPRRHRIPAPGSAHRSDRHCYRRARCGPGWQRPGYRYRDR